MENKIVSEFRKSERRKTAWYFFYGAVPVIMALLLLAAYFFTSAYAGDEISVASAKENYNILVAGLDTVGSNTDVLMLVSYKKSENSISVLQIPRDTYFDIGTSTKKINQVYSHFYSISKNSHSAMTSLCAEVEKCFGVEIDNYILSTLKGFSNFVDSIGGVTVDIPFDMNYSDPAQDLTISLSAGSHTLSGDECAQFVRYRYGYIEGDIGRVDAQKIFLACFYDKVADELGIGMAMSVIKSFADNSYTDLTLGEVTSLALSLASGARDANVNFATIPGESTRWNGNSGLWYYVANKEATYTMLTSGMNMSSSPYSDFDKNGILSTDERENIYNIYNSTSFSGEIHSKDDVGKIKIHTGNAS